MKNIPDKVFIYRDSSDDKTWLAVLQIYMSPIISGVFAWLLYALFLTGLLQGSLFPKFTGTYIDYVSVRQFFALIHPNELKDAALVLLWAFIAGFSEKMIPNILDKLASKVDTAGVDTADVDKFS